MTNGFQQGEKVWLAGHEVTFLDYESVRSQRDLAPRIGGAVVQRPGDAEPCKVPLWLLARDRAESVSRVNAIPLRLNAWDDE